MLKPHTRSDMCSRWLMANTSLPLQAYSVCLLSPAAVVVAGQVACHMAQACGSVQGLFCVCEGGKGLSKVLSVTVMSLCLTLPHLQGQARLSEPDLALWQSLLCLISLCRWKDFCTLHTTWT